MPVPAALLSTHSPRTPRRPWVDAELEHPACNTAPAGRPRSAAGVGPNDVSSAPAAPPALGPPMGPVASPRAPTTHQPPWRPDRRYEPSFRPPLRTTSCPTAPQSLLALGDARFAQENDAARAVYYWLAAHLGGEFGSSFWALLAKPPPRDPALQLFHLAHLAPEAQLARLLLRAALKREPRLLGALGRLLGCAASHATFADAYGRLHRQFGAFVFGAPARQRQLVDAMAAQDWASGLRAAGQLSSTLSHLLAPRCVAFVCNLRQQKDPSHGRLAHGEPWNPLFAGGEVLRFVMDLDADGHVNAMGAFGVAEHQALWATFLEAFYHVAPDFFAPVCFGGDELSASQLAQRMLCGLPWPEALALPLPRRWPDQAAYLRAQAQLSSPPAGQFFATLPSF